MTKVTWHDLLARYSRIRRRHRYGAHAAVAVALLLGAYALALGEQRQQQQELLDAIGQAGAQRAEKEAYLANSKAYGERLRQLEAQLRAAHVVLPDDFEVPQFLAQLGTMAHDVGVSIERFAPKEEINHDFYAEAGFHMQLRGSFHQITTLVARIGAMERIVNVTNVAMDLAKTEGQPLGVDAAFDLKIFRLLSDEQAAEAAQASKRGGKDAEAK